ncbi:NACHT, LRR and PYD domains-containing protein 12-like [Sardina pilchardus]|uniref:NACHT, LRR and PYD domains-containing protein 12-like n=1 Tax=Sardina pilchardus TaxID=27697 RepID=UPI002E0F1816
MDSTLGLLFNTLDDLRAEDLKKFQLFLTEGALEEFDRIPKGKLENCDPTDTGSIMKERYGDDGALKIMLCILREMKHNDLANKLEKELERRERESTNTDKGSDDAIRQQVIQQLKIELKNKYASIFEGPEETEVQLDEVYTDLLVTEGVSKEVNTQHEFKRIQQTTKRQTQEDIIIKCNDIMESPPGKKVRIVMTIGIAGIGKSVSVQKFCLDWAEGRANQDIDFIFLLPFRELNLLDSEQYSLFTLLLYFYPELNDMKIYTKSKILFIFDGLDESKIELNFSSTQKLHDLKKTLPMGRLLANLIQGHLLQSLIWITSRPAAANQIPSRHVNKWTEIRGFNDTQKDAYFSKRITNSHTSKIISQIKTRRSLYIMCHIPVFCWILVCVLQDMLTPDCKIEIPATMTELFIHYLLMQTNRKNQRCSGQSETARTELLRRHKEHIFKLSELAFKQLEKRNIMFSITDLADSGITDSEMKEYSEMCTTIFKKDRTFYKAPFYCFVHLSVQEFLAALHVFYSFVSENHKALESFTKKGAGSIYKLDFLLYRAVRKSLESRDGHLDLFLRFLLGISLESNQELLEGLLPQIKESSESVKTAATEIKEILSHGYWDGERCQNLLLCLLEIKDRSLHEEMERLVNSGKELTPAQCSVHAYMLLMSEDAVNEFNLSTYKTYHKGRRRLLVVLRVCRKAQLAQCDLSRDSCEEISSALQSENSLLRELDLSKNPLEDSGVELLSAGLKHANCRLDTLRLSECTLTAYSCGIMAAVLQSPNSLIELDLSHNDLGDSGVQALSKGLSSPNCKLQTLRLADCNLTNKSCEILTSVLQSPNSLLQLDLSDNILGDSGVQLLSKGLSSYNCKIHTLRFADCKLTNKSCEIVTSVLQSPNSLLQLDLSHNDLGDSGVQLLSKGLSSFNCKIHTLRLSDCLISEKGCGFLASALTSNPSHLRELDLSYNRLGKSGLKLLSARLEDPVCKLEILKTDPALAHALDRARPRLLRYACDLTLDPNTAHRNLSLSEGNRKVTYVDEKQPYPEHTERFDSWWQVLCREGLTGRCYWEAEWSGRRGTRISVAYKSIKRKGDSDDVIMGQNAKSWRLRCSPHSYSVWHNNEETAIPVPSSVSSRVGVYLDWPAGTLSFYSVSSDILTHLHTFHSTFTEPLCPGFRFYYGDYGFSVSLCQIT